MSQCRRLKRALISDKVKVAVTLARMVEAAGSYEAVKQDFEGALKRAFQQTSKECFEPKN